MARNMLETKYFSNDYWDEVVSTALCIMNRFLTKTVKNKVPQESWIGMKHNVVNLIFFSCVAYAHVPDEMRKKFDKK
jgi:hypothetical protein